MTSRTLVGLTLATLFIGGCASYTWTPSVPDDYRTIAVPVFENTTSFAELDAVTTQSILREFQREGTMRIRRVGDAPALKLIGTIKNTELRGINFDRNYGRKTSEYRYTVTAEFTLVETATGKLLLDNRVVRASTTLLSQNDLLTDAQDAQLRIAKELARQVVDSVLSYPYYGKTPPATTNSVDTSTESQPAYDERGAAILGL